MHPMHERLSGITSRRTFLVASTVGMAGLARTASAAGDAASLGNTGGRAKSTILFFLCGGSSHLDMWDMKPEAPAEYRGPFAPAATTAPGLWLSEHLPMTARQAHHLAIVKSVGATVNTNDHHAGYYHNLTGHVPDATFLSLGNNRTPYRTDWPFMGSVVASRRPAHPTLTNAISLPHMPSKLPYTRPGQFAARLGLEFDPLYVMGSLEKPLVFQAPSLTFEGDVTAQRFGNRRELLSTLDRNSREWDRGDRMNLWSRQQQRAASLLMSAGTSDALDVSREPKELRERYGETVNGMSLLAARRLVEAEVPFVTVFWKENEDKLAKKCSSAGGWDTHGNNFNCLKDDLLPEFDRGFSALIEDLADRGLIDQTLVLVSSEMGRTPKIGDRRSGGVYGAGRDHWTHCHSNVMAGGGIAGGQVYGASDRLGEYPMEKPVSPAHIAHTVYHAMGITNLEEFDSQGRPYYLLDSGEPLIELFG
ncbi:MAG: DUF1501 domain-containing protein [Planctomycetaceae bacterium]|nr:DUF1501 domain-containing protein [Planctomycetaceae bacterium]